MIVKFEIIADLPDAESAIFAALDIEGYFEDKWDDESGVTFEIEGLLEATNE